MLIPIIQARFGYNSDIEMQPSGVEPMFEVEQYQILHPEKTIKETKPETNDFYDHVELVVALLVVNFFCFFFVNSAP